MACPYFYPLAKMENCVQPARSPLGVLFDGECHADAARPVIPDPAVIREYCNFGYGRNGCGCFPSSAPADAVRFSNAGSGMVFVLELNYSPVQFGSAGSIENHSLLQRQMEAFREGLSQ